MKRKSETCLKVFVGSAALGAGLAFVAVAFAWAQEANSGGEFNTPFGFRPGETEQPIEGGTRDENGNRLIVNGRIMSSSSYAHSSLVTDYPASGVGAGSATAIGNNLTVITDGSYNTVVINSNQVNNGDQEANVVLNGSLNLD
ncbi:MAG: holdfast anchoring protein HfaA [Alphaproteobacteria bacterium]|nr:holdfast anchoring protein HfaA [Alphaproteobacteria bacterium]